MSTQFTKIDRTQNAVNRGLINAIAKIKTYISTTNKMLRDSYTVLITVRPLSDRDICEDEDLDGTEEGIPLISVRSVEEISVPEFFYLLDVIKHDLLDVGAEIIQGGLFGTSDDDEPATI